MITAVASGKGGTGKTTVTASLAVTWAQPVMAVDLDVEEPNLHLFLQPTHEESRQVFLEVPEIDKERCTCCHKCSELCQFKAISVMPQMIMAFPEMCHGCGGCMAICPEGAISKGRRLIGSLETGHTSTQLFSLTGRLRIGEAMSPPLMRAARQAMRNKANTDNLDILVDSPPGVSCPAMNAVADSDVILLVTEPTPFGFHDFQLAWEAFSALRKPMAVLINRAGLGDRRVYRFCEEHNLPVIAQIPYSRDIAEHYSKGQILAEMNSDLHLLFTKAARQLRALGQEGGHA